MSFVNLLHLRRITTTATNHGKHNFRKFLIPNKRGTRHEKAMRGKPGGLPIDHRGVRPIGITEADQFKVIPEMIPELIVPDLTDCKFKPYVSYRVPEVTQTEFTSQDLFNVIYAEKIIKDFKEGKLEEDGSPKEPTENENLTAEEAWRRARKTGSDFI